MNLIELFESKPFQDVGTFNSVFRRTPILGFALDLEVEIGAMTPMGRRLKIGDAEIILNLAIDDKGQKLKVAEVRKDKFQKPEKIKTLAKIYKELNPSEFMIYSAIKDLGVVYGITDLAASLNMSRKTIFNNLKTLQEKNIVQVSTDYRNISKMVLTQEIK
jgi:hypothetical protein